MVLLTKDTVLEDFIRIETIFMHLNDIKDLLILKDIHFFTIKLLIIHTFIQTLTITQDTTDTKEKKCSFFMQREKDFFQKIDTFIKSIFIKKDTTTLTSFIIQKQQTFLNLLKML